IDKLIASNSVSIVSENIANKEDLINRGVDFVELNPIIVIDIPKNGAIVRDVKVTSTNGAAIVVTLTTVEGETLSPIRGNPTSLPNDKFPTELVAKIVIEILETTDNHSPKQVTLSVVACAPGVTVGTTEGTTPGTTTGTTTGTTAGTTSTVQATGETTITIATEETKAATAGSTTAGEVKTTSEVEESTQGTTREVVETTGETAPTVLTTGASTPQPAETTTTTFQCNHMEYIDKLIASNSVSIVSENIANKEDLINR
ncbi:unnamed protein product, partial [Adineta steineri]